MRETTIYISITLVAALITSVAFANEPERRTSPHSISCGDNVRACVQDHRGALLPIGPSQDWIIDEVNSTTQRNFVRLAATWEGLRTLGASAVVTLDRAGKILFVDGGARPLVVQQVTTTIDENDAKKRAMNALHSTRGGIIPKDAGAPVEKIVLVDGYTGTIVYEVKVGLPAEMGVAFVYVNAESGDIIWVRNPVQH